MVGAQLSTPRSRDAHQRRRLQATHVFKDEIDAFRVEERRAHEWHLALFKQLLNLLGLVLQTGFSLPSAKLLLILLFLLITGPTATYALANAALQSGIKNRANVSFVTTALKTSSMGELIWV